VTWEDKVVPVTGSATAVEKIAREADGEAQHPQRTLRVWLHGWAQVLIAELLHLLAGRRDSSVS